MSCGGLNRLFERFRQIRDERVLDAKDTNLVDDLAPRHVQLLDDLTYFGHVARGGVHDNSVRCSRIVQTT